MGQSVRARRRRDAREERYKQAVYAYSTVGTPSTVLVGTYLKYARTTTLGVGLANARPDARRRAVVPEATKFGSQTVSDCGLTILYRLDREHSTCSSRNRATSGTHEWRAGGAS